MAKTISDLQTDLAHRLGEASAPTSTSELAKRRNWMKHAIEFLISKERNYWWQLQKYLDTSADDEPYYFVPTGLLSVEQIKVNDWEHDKVSFNDVYERYETPLKPVPILPRFQLNKVFYLRNNKIYILPKPDAPTSYSVSSLTSSGTTCTATTSSAHGYKEGDYVTIAGANESAYNGAFEITEVPSTTTFTYEASSTPSATPATGTITATRQNIEIWGYDDFATELAAFTDSSSIIVPDNFSDLIVAYAEGRFWSTAHKRGKAADAFDEYEEWRDAMDRQQARRRFGEM